LNSSTGTVEVRAPDAQSSVEDAEALIAVIHAAAADIMERHDAGEPQHLHAAIAIDENRWRAAADGVTGELLDLDKGVMVPTRDLLAKLLDRIDPVARRQGNSPGIDHARALLEFDMPGTLRAIARSDGIRGVCDWLATRTEQTALRHDSPTNPPGTDVACPNERRSRPTKMVR